MLLSSPVRSAAGCGQEPVELPLREQDGGREAVEGQLEECHDLGVDSSRLLDLLAGVEVLQ